MIDLRDLNGYRAELADRERYGLHTGKKAGVFIVPNNPLLRVIADSGQGWDHVSVSTVKRTPTWAEMEKVKRLFFKPTETAFQFHVPPTKHINIHPYTLHLWRPTFKHIPLPSPDRV